MVFNNNFYYLLNSINYYLYRLFIYILIINVFFFYIDYSVCSFHHAHFIIFLNNFIIYLFKYDRFFSLNREISNYESIVKKNL